MGGAVGMSYFCRSKRGTNRCYARGTCRKLAQSLHEHALQLAHLHERRQGIKAQKRRLRQENKSTDSRTERVR